ncbi:hypothetical protein lerEdw1_015901 [Lerista edwardsae]|nr:hypothetical protein lerEdw1_015901 [Lerista edwardsae]
MRAALCVFGLILTCMLHLATGIPVQPGFNYEKMEGVWLRTAMALQGPESDAVGDHIRIRPMSKGDLSVDKTFEIRRTCRQGSSRFRHTSTPGKFNIFSWGSQTTIHFVATDYKSYLVLHIQTADDRGLYLFVRGSEVSDSIKKKFEQHSESLGFSKSSIHYLDSYLAYEEDGFGNPIYS